jgi:hypothetical protein
MSRIDLINEIKTILDKFNIEHEKATGEAFHARDLITNRLDDPSMVIPIEGLMELKLSYEGKLERMILYNEIGDLLSKSFDASPTFNSYDAYSIIGDSESSTELLRELKDRLQSDLNRMKETKPSSRETDAIKKEIMELADKLDLSTSDFSYWIKINQLLSIEKTPYDMLNSIREDLQTKVMYPDINKACNFCKLGNCDLVCSKCKNTYYCSIECQREDWKKHKLSSRCHTS